jgi:hypothetical protein
MKSPAYRTVAAVPVHVLRYILSKQIFMSKTGDNSTYNQQQHGHEEGQMNNTPANSRNNHQGMRDMNPGNKKSVNQSSETESDRANRNEDEGIRGGNSSI